MTIPTVDAFSPANEANLLRETEHARLRALINADIVRAQQLHAPDFQLITPIGATLSKEEYLGAIASGQINYLIWEPADIAVRLHDGVAVLRYRAQLEVVFGGHKVALNDYWHTDTYERHDGRWMVVWSQATAIN
ncbi:nuclear transport factor 2 family protein [Rhizobium leguminosarum]|uniref:nuclear transport factor 2 family protein n=1 Tax=Rhizobium leguminosarum TaxID=384 RepID=UPI000FEC5739|nr:nuclear transport factor 2 family protein [Rhizobium leguminosarum]MBY2919927.1 nuclear transport factor 2 family protein [Rhizobium leguminosarum]MBY2966146.1 nuclear transport factor 2 family protein [Rhizobium leguminosarum]MBY2985187.1 nuclear transport factor 2 family protein [Rhizobium leguminosarum]MBY3023154.1 nuclear transport factor 2 family protein [Rhizobium leguminosarum]RWX23896.1 nuclear transport factor 2 family protein [Rhizobium leguminosarum]